MRLKGKIAVITGAGSGIGKSSALLFSKEGATVVIVDVNEENGKRVVDIIGNDSKKAIFVKADVSNAQQVQEMVKNIIKTYGRIDILVNCVGVLLQGNILDTSEADWDRIMKINLNSAFLCCKFLIPEMIKNSKGGNIVNVSSEAGLNGVKNLAAYSVSKGAMISLTKCVALDFVDQNIRVNCVCPGTTETEMVKTMLAESTEPKKLRKAYENRPAKRLGTPEEIAAGILYLASDESPYAIGAILSIDGGSTINLF